MNTSSDNSSSSKEEEEQEEEAEEVTPDQEAPTQRPIPHQQTLVEINKEERKEQDHKEQDHKEEEEEEDSLEFTPGVVAAVATAVRLVASTATLLVNQRGGSMADS